jgi:hypothetical protein
MTSSESGIALAEYFEPDFFAGVRRILDLGGDKGRQALEIISKYHNIENAAVLEPTVVLCNAKDFAPQLRSEFGEANFNKLLYVPKKASLDVPLDYDVYIIRDLALWPDEKKVEVLQKMAEKKIIIVNTAPYEQLDEILRKCKLDRHGVRRMSDVYIVEPYKI